MILSLRSFVDLAKINIKRMQAVSVRVSMFTNFTTTS